MNDIQQIESFRYIKVARRLLQPTTECLENISDSDMSEELKFEAILSLGMIGDNHSIDTLTRAFDNHSESIEAITALGHFKSSSHVPKLLERLKDPDVMFKEEIVRVLGVIGDPMAIKMLLETLHDEDRMVRYYSARALYIMGGRDVVQSLCGLINDPDEWIVINVLEILSKLKDPEAIPALVGQFEIVRDFRLKAIIVSSLGTFNENSLLKVFESGLDSFDPRIQANSVEAISHLRISGLEMKRKLKRFYGHPNNRVRANVCIALVNVDREMVIEELTAMHSSSNASNRRSAAFVLARIDIELCEKFIHELLRDENFGVRKMALKAALTLTSGIGACEILPLIGDENQWVRKEALECAIRIKDFPEDEILAMLKKEKSPVVIEFVLKFLISRNLTCSIHDIFERVKQETEEEMIWLIAALGHLGACEELLKVKKFLGAVRSDIFSEYYKALLLNGKLDVFDDIAQVFSGNKREAELIPWVKIAGNIGSFIQRPEGYSLALLKAFTPEIQKDMEGVAVLNGEIEHESSSELLKKGIDAFVKGDYRRSHEILFKLLSSEPSNIEARYYLSYNFYNLGEIEKSTNILSSIIDDEPSYINAAILLGQIYFRKKEWKQLSNCYEKIIKFVNKDDKKSVIKIYGALGLAYFNQKQYEKAISSLMVGLKANPRDLSSSYHLALCYYATEEGEKARIILEDLKKLLPTDSQILKNVIELLQRI